jgi:hypothetical protein
VFLRHQDYKSCSCTILGGSDPEFLIVDLGSSASATIGVDSNFRVCTQVTLCARGGPGASAGAAGVVTLGAGTFCEGNSVSGGAFVEGGAGGFGGASANYGSEGGSADISIKPGLGGGGAAGAQLCTTKTHCLW